MYGTEEPLAAEEPRKSRRSSRRLIVAGALAVLLAVALFVPPLVNLGHYRRSIISSISAALGRPVAVGDMQLRLLPTPGITLTDFTVAEDPAFGFEPALHANSVVVSLRLSSLWRGRLEVSRISLDEASLNLVKTANGAWSIESILLRTSQMPNEATGQRHAGAYPRFPYIEATDARINFKEGAEKRPFSLMNAEFAMWQASGNEWRMRLRAQPVRTDLELHLSDTGELNVEGSFQRADRLRTIPVKLQAEWSGAQLGQVSRLLAGMDSGWRGGLDVTGSIDGTAGNLALKTHIHVGNLRRQEFQPQASMDINATCQSRYEHALELLGQITCFLPEGAGHLLLSGSVQEGAAAETDLQLEINQVPAEFPLRLLGLMRPHAGNVTVTGTINGSFRLVRNSQRPLTGDATATGMTVNWPGGPLALPELHLVANPAPAKGRKHRATPAPAQANAVVLEPAAIRLGAATTLTADARVTRTGFTLHLAGQAELSRLMAAGANFGLLENALAAAAPRGRAQLDTTTTGSWMPPLAGATDGIATTGTVRVDGVELRPRFLHSPVEVVSADVELTPQQITWQNVVLRYGGLAMRASFQFPSDCGSPGACPGIFALQADSLNATSIESALAGRPEGFFGQMLSDLGAGQSPTWPPLRGTVECGDLSLGRLSLKNVAATVSLQQQKLTIEALNAAALGGTLHATGTMSVVSAVPEWNLDVRMAGVKVSGAADLFKERWGSGTASGEAQWTMNGYSTADLASSAAGTFRMTWQNGGLAAGETFRQLPVAHFDRWTAAGTIGNDRLTLAGGTMVRGQQTARVRGEVGFNRHLNLTLQTARGRMKIGGTVARPVAER